MGDQTQEVFADDNELAKKFVKVSGKFQLVRLPSQGIRIGQIYKKPHNREYAEPIAHIEDGTLIEPLVTLPKSSVHTAQTLGIKENTGDKESKGVFLKFISAFIPSKFNADYENGKMRSDITELDGNKIKRIMPETIPILLQNIRYTLDFWCISLLNNQVRPS